METRTITVVDQDFGEMDAYRDLVKACKRDIPEGAFTRQQFRKDTGMTETTSWRLLNEMVEAGVLESRLATVEGKSRRLYWFARGGEDD